MMVKAEEIEKNLQIMEVVENELEKQKKESIFCLLVFVTSLNVWVLLVALWYYLGKPISTDYMTIGIELFALTMLGIILKFTSLDIHNMGITNKNLKRSLIRSVIVSVVAVAAMICYKVLKMPGVAICNWDQFDFNYVITAVLQEFLSRGFLLTTLIFINSSMNNRLIAVICSSLMFMTLHLYLGFAFMLAAGILSAILSFCYLKDENIWGVSIIHFVIGTAALVMEIV